MSHLSRSMLLASMSPLLAAIGCKLDEESTNKLSGDDVEYARRPKKDDDSGPPSLTWEEPKPKVSTRPTPLGCPTYRDQPTKLAEKPREKPVRFKERVARGTMKASEAWAMMSEGQRQSPTGEYVRRRMESEAPE